LTVRRAPSGRRHRYAGTRGTGAHGRPRSRRSRCRPVTGPFSLTSGTSGTDTDGVHNGVGRSGLGFIIDRPADRADDGFRYAHGGTCTGFRAEVVGYPNRNAGVVAVANRNRTGLARQIVRAAEATYNW
jgi:hypothetical protein